MNTQRTRHKIPIDLQQLACITVSLPVIGFLFCITWSFWFNFEVSNIFLINFQYSIIAATKTLSDIHFYINFQNATYTHCEVTNLAPSISAAIGSFVPQKYIWQACISLHSAPRFLFLYLYNQLFYERLVVTNLHFCNTVSTKFLIKVIRFIILKLANILDILSEAFRLQNNVKPVVDL